MGFRRVLFRSEHTSELQSHDNLVSRRRHTRLSCDWSSDVCLGAALEARRAAPVGRPPGGERLPRARRAAPPGPEFASLPFSSLYLLDDEWAAEIANETMHGVLHVGWVPDGDADGHRGQLAVLANPTALLGTAYRAPTGPSRPLLVSPPMIRQIEREWRAR